MFEFGAAASDSVDDSAIEEVTCREIDIGIRGFEYYGRIFSKIDVSIILFDSYVISLVIQNII